MEKIVKTWIKRKYDLTGSHENNRFKNHIGLRLVHTFILTILV